VTQALEKLENDLEIVEAMASEMNEYLNSDVLFWPMQKGDFPRLTIGGYLIRQHRLNGLRELLDNEQRSRLDAVIDLFNQALVEKVVRFEERAHQEIQARMRQWSEYLKEAGTESLSIGNYYASAVEPRAMIAAILDKLEMPPYELDKSIPQQLVVYDNALRRHWLPGTFIWPEEWAPAYPKSEYWWLYGRPQ